MHLELGVCFAGLQIGWRRRRLLHGRGQCLANGGGSRPHRGRDERPEAFDLRCASGPGVCTRVRICSRVWEWVKVSVTVTLMVRIKLCIRERASSHMASLSADMLEAGRLVMLDAANAASSAISCCHLDSKRVANISLLGPITEGRE